MLTTTNVKAEYTISPHVQVQSMGEYILSKLKSIYKFKDSNFRVYQLICDNLNLIPDEQLKTLMALSKFMQNAYPTIETISTMTGRSKRSVIRDIKKLEKLKIISVKRQHRQSNIYNCTLGDTAMSLNGILGCQNEQVRVTKTASLGDTAMAPHHINNHINKHIKENDFSILDEPEEVRVQFIKSLIKSV